ncbi:MAG: formate/nitrite transporter family protein [Acidobacteriota bacterium]|nr:formate/nitrite transporter family protein [Acidobacteriota bacterium]
MATNYLSPKEVAESSIGITSGKASLSIGKMLVLGFLAGAYIAFGALASTLVSHDLPLVGVGRLVTGMVFSAGLMMVLIGGAELFTGNILIWTGVLSGKVGVGAMLRNWFWVYVANFLGSLAVVAMMYYSGLWGTNNNMVGAYALKIAVGKCGLTFTSALMRGILCNWLVSLAVWMSWSCKDIVSKVFAVFFPITLFVAANFEHSVANMYYIPAGLLLKANPAMVDAAHLADKVGVLTWHSFLINNLLPVTIGNILGAALFVASAYWFSYLKGAKAQAAASPAVEGVGAALVASAIANNCPVIKACPANNAMQELAGSKR